MRSPIVAFAILIFLQPISTFGYQQMIVEPFLQQATANSIWVVWETSAGAESIVEFGETPFALVSTATGTAINNVGQSIIHQTHLTGLQPDTRYFYRAKTNGVESEVFDFRTPSISDSGYPLRFAAYSDSQFDSGNPTKHSEIVNDGIIDYVTENYGNVLNRELAFVVMPGDLVSNGNTHSHWTDHFFAQAKNLYSHVPLYPVTGNHEVDSPIYFRYFNLPTNGTPGFLEHWYYHDQGNVRIIGLDTNTTYRIPQQLNWLVQTLNDAATNEDIDFVFAQLHHPHKSELWTPGNTDYTGQIIERLENFTQQSGKPSIHFFGHTHGYSRGQSRDHQHLWVNVASGGGNVDYWGEFPIADYPEFEITTPDYGFVIVEVIGGPNPSFEMKRLSRGNEIVFKDNELTDEITIRMNNSPPQKPTAVGCSTNGQLVDPNEVVLQASTFVDVDGDDIRESHFQVSATTNFSQPVRDVWLRNRNLYSPANASGPSNGYFSVDTVTDPDIDKTVVSGLSSKTEYYWRVRFRDSGLVWSDWSETASFVTGVSSLGPNLLSNPGAENGISGWTVVDDPLESLLGSECNSGTEPLTGNRFFAVGGVCLNEGPYGEAVQLIDVSNQASEINAGNVIARFGGFLKNFGGIDRPEIWLVFLSPNQLVIEETKHLAGESSQWTEAFSELAVPGGTHFVEFHISGTRLGGVDNDCYFDDLNLQVGLDSEQTYEKGDVNQDGSVNLLDVDPFVEILSSGDYQFEADLNCDGLVNLLDVSFFIELLAG